MAGTRQLPGGEDLPAVKEVLREGVENLGEDIPEVFREQGFFLGSIEREMTGE